MRRGARQDRPCFHILAPFKSPQSRALKQGWTAAVRRASLPRSAACWRRFVSARHHVGFSRIPAGFGFLWFFRRPRLGGHRTQRSRGHRPGRRVQQGSVNHWALTSFSAGPCDRGNLCRRRPNGEGGGVAGRERGGKGAAGNERRGQGREARGAARQEGGEGRERGDQVWQEQKTAPSRRGGDQERLGSGTAGTGRGKSVQGHKGRAASGSRWRGKSGTRREGRQSLPAQPPSLADHRTKFKTRPREDY